MLDLQQDCSDYCRYFGNYHIHHGEAASCEPLTFREWNGESMVCLLNNRYLLVNLWSSDDRRIPCPVAFLFGKPYDWLSIYELESLRKCYWRWRRSGMDR